MAKKKDYMKPARDALGMTVGLSVGAIGAGVVGSVAAPLAGTTTGTVITQGALPMFGTGLMAGAGKYAAEQTHVFGRRKKRR